MNKLKAFSLAVLISVLPSLSQAGWSFNFGYHNPPGSVVGLNFLHLWTDWAFEFGLGYVKSGEDDKKKNSFIMSGDVDLKYLFSSGDLRPYVQVGTGWGFSAVGNSAGVGVGGGLYMGGGLFIMASNVYAYGSYNVNGSGNGFPQAGLGFNF